MVDTLFSLVPHALGLVALFWAITFGYRMVRALSLGSAMEELHSVKAAREWIPTDLEVSAARLRAARASRRRAEHSSWEASFSALVVARGGCPVCAGRGLHRG